MFENMLSAGNVNFILVFLEGILSFFSPCVLPLIPIYITYLAGNGKQVDEAGNITYKRKAVFLNTILFVIGISFAFFILGMSFSALGTFFKENKEIFTKIAGIIIILMGVIQLGIFKIPFFQKEHKIHAKIDLKKMNPIVAFVMGFTFSFAWTPCIGPALASVLVLASSSTSIAYGNFLVFIYAIGFVIPFLLLGLFTTKILNFLKTKQKVLQYTIKISAVILMIIGIMTVTGMVEGISNYLTKITNNKQVENVVENQTSNNNTNVEQTNENTSTNVTEEKEQNTEESKNMALDFTLVDQNGVTHKIADYRGKVVFLNFWATWCPPCQREMPHIEELYKEYGYNQKDVVILGVTNPKSKEYPYAQDESKETIIQFLKEKQYTFPTVFDTTGEVLDFYYINSFPTTFMINKEGEIFGYVNGMMDKKTMQSIITQTLENKKK